MICLPIKLNLFGRDISIQFHIIYRTSSVSCIKGMSAFESASRSKIHLWKSRLCLLEPRAQCSPYCTSVSTLISGRVYLVGPRLSLTSSQEGVVELPVLLSLFFSCAHPLSLEDRNYKLENTFFPRSAQGSHPCGGTGHGKGSVKQLSPQETMSL